MKNISHLKLVIVLLLISSFGSVSAQTLRKVLDLRGYWKFMIGDNSKWSDPAFNDTQWEKIRVPDNWENQGFHGYNGYAWYRTSFDGSNLNGIKGSLSLVLGYIDDIDEVYLNGVKIGLTGSFPPHFATAYDAKREYFIPMELVKKDQKNTIAVRVYDAMLEGGIVSGDVGIFINDQDKDLVVNLRGIWNFKLLPNWRIGKAMNSEMLKEQSRFSNTNPNTLGWTDLRVPLAWEHQGYGQYDGGAIYRKEFKIPFELKGETLTLVIGAIDDRDWVYLNGIALGQTEGHDKMRVYTVTPDIYKIGEVNVLTIYVEDSTGFGGITEGPVGLIRQVDFTRFIRWR